MKEWEGVKTEKFNITILTKTRGGCRMRKKLLIGMLVVMFVAGYAVQCRAAVTVTNFQMTPLSSPSKGSSADLPIVIKAGGQIKITATISTDHPAGLDWASCRTNLYKGIAQNTGKVSYTAGEQTAKYSCIYKIPRAKYVAPGDYWIFFAALDKGGSRTGYYQSKRLTVKIAAPGWVSDVSTETLKEGQVCFFSSFINPDKTLDKDIWEYEPDLTTKRHWGFWHSFPITKEGDWACQTQHADKVLSSRAFKKSPLRGEFVFTFDAILPNQPYECVGILDVALVNDMGGGYGVQLVFILPDDSLGTEVTCRLNPSSGYKARVLINDAVNAITSFNEGEKKILALVEGDKVRLRRTGEGYGRIPIRLERSSEGELTLSMDGKIVVRVKDSTHDNFTKLVAISPTSNCRVAFDNPKVIGNFSLSTH